VLVVVLGFGCVGRRCDRTLMAGLTHTLTLSLPGRGDRAARRIRGENGEYEDGLFLWWEGHPGC